MEGYDVLHVIGSGSFGTVFMGRRKHTNENVALKKISKGGRSEREIRSLRQECEIQKNLHHPNIIQMLDSFETDDSVVVVTELAQGDLCRYIIKEGRLTTGKVQFVACHLVSALYFLHSHRTLHRDIKPQNILIGWDGKAKLCDFGFARTMGIDTYMLTSVKGTPLYMAPEIVQEKPYDHNADLWSLGCILYELMVGNPPFFTTSLFQLVRKIKCEAIVWPEYIAGDCLSFLQGLLEKDPQKRLTWPALLKHPFVKDGLYIDKTAEEFSLTKALSPSQELAKEKQRIMLQRKLAGYSKLLAKTTKKMEEAQKELKRYSEDGRMGVKTPFSSPNGMPVTRPATAAVPVMPPQPCAVIGVPPQDPLKISPTLPSPNSDAKSLRVMFQNLKLRAEGVNNREGDVNLRTSLDVRLKTEEEQDRNSASSCETMTSSSEFETGSEDDSDAADDDTNTVIMDDSKKREVKKRNSLTTRRHVRLKSNDSGNVEGLGLLEANRSEKPNRGGSGLPWKSGALFTLHSFGSEDKPINSDEWIYFIMNTMKEVLDNPKSLCEKHFLTMLVAPLRNHLAESEVVEKIAVLLALPFTLDKSIHEMEPGLMSNLHTLYLDTKVLPNLLYSCKLIVRRRRIERGSVGLEEIPTILTVEDLEGLEKCLRLVAFLVYVDDDFVTQLCDSVCVLQVFAILQLFLKLDGVRSGLAADTIAVLCHILRTFPSNISIVEEILLDESDSNSTDSHSELWRLITHSNSTIQSRSLRLFTYLCVYSERVKTEILTKCKSRVWKVLRRATISSQPEIRDTAEFALQALNCKSVASAKSNSTNNSGCPSQVMTAPVASALCESLEERNDESPKNSVESAKNDEEFSVPANLSCSTNLGTADDPSR